MCGNEPCAHERGDAITSFVTQTRALVAVTAERDAALATIERVNEVITGWRATDRVRISDLRAALEPTQPEIRRT